MLPRITRRTGCGTSLDYLMGIPEFAAMFNKIALPPWKYETGYNLRGELALLWGVWQAAMRYEGLLLFTGRGRFKPEVLAVFLLSFLPRRWRPAIVFCGEAWEPNSGWRAIVDRIIVRFTDRAINRYALLSSDEQRLFPLIWGIEPNKVCFVPYMYTLTDEERAKPVERGSYIFVGGNSFRDYGPLVEAARTLPEYQFVCATRKLDRYPNLPPNVRAGQMPSDVFSALLRGANVVVVPLLMGTKRASGQQTYLNAMALGKLVIVNDAFGVRDYIRHGENGLIVEGSPDSYIEALRWAFDPANAPKVEHLIAQAREDALWRFNPTQHACRLVALMQNALAEETIHRSSPYRVNEVNSDVS